MMPDARIVARWLDDEEAQIKRLIARRDRLDAEIAKSTHKASLLKALLALQTNAYVVEQTTLPKGRFSDGVSVRDAALTVLREQRRATLDEIIAALEAGGLDFNGHSPKRVVFLTLTNLIRSKNGSAPIRREKGGYVYLEKGD